MPPQTHMRILTLRPGFTGSRTSPCDPIQDVGLAAPGQDRAEQMEEGSGVPTDAGSLFLGIILTAAGAAVLALSLVAQRYALSYPGDRVPMCGLHLHRDVAWFAGLLLYGAANGLKVVGLRYGALEVLASVFTLVLVFNLVFARCAMMMSSVVACHV